jgi:hypothetical protein
VRGRQSPPHLGEYENSLEERIRRRTEKDESEGRPWRIVAYVGFGVFGLVVALIALAVGRWGYALGFGLQGLITLVVGILDACGIRVILSDDDEDED